MQVANPNDYISGGHWTCNKHLFIMIPLPILRGQNTVDERVFPRDYDDGHLTCVQQQLLYKHTSHISCIHIQGPQCRRRRRLIESKGISFTLRLPSLWLAEWRTGRVYPYLGATVQTRTTSDGWMSSGHRMDGESTRIIYVAIHIQGPQCRRRCQLEGVYFISRPAMDRIESRGIIYVAISFWLAEWGNRSLVRDTLSLGCWCISW